MVERRLASVVPEAVMVPGFEVTSMFINALKTCNRRAALAIPDGDAQNIERETFYETLLLCIAMHVYVGSFYCSLTSAQDLPAFCDIDIEPCTYRLIGAQI